MNIGERLYELRKGKNLSQEEVADKLNVTRQTISKWETNQSSPDFDKIKPLCDLYGITADELLTGIKKEEQEPTMSKQDIKRERANGIAAGVLFYFIAIIWIMVAIPVLLINPITASAIFLGLCGIATYKMIYTCMMYKKDKKEVEENEKNPIIKRIGNIIDILSLIIYLLISFTTMAWYITWIIFIIDGLVKEIVKLIFELKGEPNEE